MSQPERSTQHVWEELGGRLRAYFQARVSDASAADDLVQEAFVRIHQGLGALTEHDRLAPWVFTIARNLLIDHYRAGKTRQGISALDAADDAASMALVADEPDCNARIASWLPAAIDELPVTFREAVRLFELEQLSQHEIAERLGLSLTAVKSRVRRGRKALAQVVNGCCVFELDRRGNILDYNRRQPDCC